MGDFGAGFAGGYGRGKLQAIESRRNNRRDMRALDIQEMQIQNAHQIQQGELAIAMQDLGIRQRDAEEKQYDFERRKEIDAGLSSAMQEGGYTLGIEYLKNMDPMRAIAFHSEKLKLDDQILKNDVMKTIAPVEKQKALFEAYGLLGKTSAGIESLPQGERSKAWKMMLPMIKPIWPDAPEEYSTKAQIANRLFMAQGTPENILFASEKNSAVASTKLGELYKAKEELAINGQMDTPIYADIQKQIEGLRSKSEEAILQGLEAKMKIAKTQQQATESFNKTLESSSTDYLKAMDSYSQVKAHIESLKDDPKNAYKQSVIQRMFIKSVNSGAMSIADESLGDQATGSAGLNKKLQSLISGSKVNLSSQEVMALSSAWETSIQGKLEKQLSVESKYKKSAQNYDNIQKDALRYPSQVYYDMLDAYKQQKTDDQVVAKLPSPEMQNQAKEALEKYKNDPEKRAAVLEKIQQVLQGK